MDIYTLTPETQKVQEELSNTPVNKWLYPKVLVFVPLERNLPYADYVLPQFTQMAQRGADFIWSDYSAVAIGRNKAAIQLLGTDYTHVLMLDDDHVHPADIIERLAKWVVVYPEIKVVGGLNFGRRPPYDPCFALKKDDGWYVPTEWESGKLMEVDMLGTGCILISREVFEDLQPPWFENDFSMWETGYYAGEDTVFSRRCREAGIKLYCDPDITSPHLTIIGVTEETWRSYNATHR